MKILKKKGFTLIEITIGIAASLFIMAVTTHFISSQARFQSILNKIDVAERNNLTLNTFIESMSIQWKHVEINNNRITPTNAISSIVEFSRLSQISDGASFTGNSTSSTLNTENIIEMLAVRKDDINLLGINIVVKSPTGVVLLQEPLTEHIYEEIEVIEEGPLISIILTDQFNGQTVNYIARNNF